MILDIGYALLWINFGLIVVSMVTSIRRRRRGEWDGVIPLELTIDCLGLIVSVLLTIGTAMKGKPDVIFVIGIPLFGFLLWTDLRDRNNRRRHRKALKALGAKARARIEAMKRKIAERPARPVLRPVPVRAGA